MASLIKFVLTNGRPGDCWFTQHDSLEPMLEIWRRSPFDYAVERWWYPELADGTHGSPTKSVIQARLDPITIPEESEECDTPTT